MMSRTLALLNETIAELEAKLNLQPNEPISGSSNSNSNGTVATVSTTTTTKSVVDGTKKTNNNNNNQRNNNIAATNTSTDNNNATLPDICKLEFKVGIITKVWVHEKADKLYCEEIDVGEENPRQIASGLRPHFTLEQMLGQRLLVVSNLKPKNLVGFKSHGMVLCAVHTTNNVGDDDTNEIVEFVEPPIDAPIGEIITFNGLPTPQPLSASQCDKQKIFLSCMEHMTTNIDRIAVWKDQHTFMTSKGPCTTKTVSNGKLR